MPAMPDFTPAGVRGKNPDIRLKADGTYDVTGKTMGCVQWVARFAGVSDEEAFQRLIEVNLPFRLPEERQ